MRDHLRACHHFGIFAAIISMFGVNLASAAEEPEHYDCGTFSLYTLLQIEGCKSTLGELKQRLREIPKAGYSMKQIRDAARESNLALEGILWKDKVFAQAQATLAFVKQGDHGHYVVIRPVGRSGKMVQLFDNKLDVGTYDFTELTAAPEWTGLILRVKHQNWLEWISILVLIVTFGLTARRFVRSWLIRRRDSSVTVETSRLGSV